MENERINLVNIVENNWTLGKSKQDKQRLLKLITLKADHRWKGKRIALPIKKKLRKVLPSSLQRRLDVDEALVASRKNKANKFIDKIAAIKFGKITKREQWAEQLKLKFTEFFSIKTFLKNYNIEIPYRRHNLFLGNLIMYASNSDDERAFTLIDEVFKDIKFSRKADSIQKIAQIITYESERVIDSVIDKNIPVSKKLSLPFLLIKNQVEIYDCEEKFSEESYQKYADLYLYTKYDENKANYKGRKEKNELLETLESEAYKEAAYALGWTPNIITRQLKCEAINSLILGDIDSYNQVISKVPFNHREDPELALKIKKEITQIIKNKLGTKKLLVKKTLESLTKADLQDLPMILEPLREALLES